MEALKNLFLHNLPRKLFSLILAIAVWFYVSYSITETRIFPKILVRVVNVPADKTIVGLHPNGTLDKRLSVTLTGKKKLIDRLDRKDFEIVLDAQDKSDEWLVHLDKRNLISRNPDFDFMRDISQVTNTDFILHFSKIASMNVPILFNDMKGDPPDGYQFVDVIPAHLTHLIVGPEEEVRKLREGGLEVTFDLGLITKDELDAIASQNKNGGEISFPVPDSWKKVSIPFLDGIKQELNSAEAKNLHINFLRQEFLPIQGDIPVVVYYPLTTLTTHNPNTCPLKPSSIIEQKGSFHVIHRPLYVSTVSRKFLDIVRDHVEILVISDASAQGQKLRWEVHFVDAQNLEDRYVSKNLEVKNEMTNNDRTFLVKQEQLLRNRFKEYMSRFKLFEANGIPLTLDINQDSDGITITD